MGVREMLRVGESRALTERRALAAEAQLEIIQEALVDLELAMDDRGWVDLVNEGEKDFTRDGLRRICRTSRVMAIASPLLKRGLNIRQAYIWGGGVEISARANEENEGQDVNAVVQAYLDDPLNRQAWCGPEAQEQLERALGTDGNVFLAQFTLPRSGRVQTRVLPFDQIQEIYFNPDDASEPWYYLRVYEVTTINTLGAFVQEQRRELYPALRYRPATRPRQLMVEGYGLTVVKWDAPVRHVKVNGLQGQKWGIGDLYPALPWTRLHKDFLTDWALLTKSLSQFAWRATSKGSNKDKADALRRGLQRAATPAVPGNRGSVGGVAVLDDNSSLEAMPKTGATIDSESGKPLAAMVASALGVPVTMLLADPGTTGARAVAETLDTPTINEMNQRRTVWAEVRKDILEYVVLQAVKAPEGELHARIVRDDYGYEQVEWPDETDATIDVVFPDLDETDPEVLIKSLVLADGTGKVPPLVMVRLLLQALGVEDVDEIVESVTGPDGEWEDPVGAAAAAAGQAAVDAFRRGEDPALASGGDPDEEDVPEDDEDEEAPPSRKR